MHKKFYDNTGLLSVDKQQQLRQSKVDRKETRRQKKQKPVWDRIAFVIEVRTPAPDLQSNLIMCVPSKRMRYFSIQNHYDVTAHHCVRTSVAARCGVAACAARALELRL